MDEILLHVFIAHVGHNEKPLTNESYHTTWRMKLFYEWKWNFVINKTFDEIDNMNEC
jgi:hypothetical protein